MRGDKAFTCFSLDGYGVRYWLFVQTMPEGDYRGSIREATPEWIARKGQGITAYGLEQDTRIAYIGPLDLLIARGIAPAVARDERCGHAAERGLGSPAVWTCERLPDGLALFVDLVADREQYARREAERLLVSAKTPAEWLEHNAVQIHTIATAFLRLIKRPSVNKDGKVFTLAPESHEPIQEALEDFIHAIRGARMLSRDKAPAVRVLAQAARSDPAFRAFLRTSTGTIART